MAKRSIVIAGSIAQKPGSGGHTWVFLQYLLGFKQLGWKVTFIDRLEPEMCADAAGAPAGCETSWNARYFFDVMRTAGLGGDAGLLYQGQAIAPGLDRAQIVERLRTASALINVMGYLEDEELLAAARQRVFLDIDPGFGQMWHALGLHDAFRGHDAFATIGENIGRPDCRIPTCGLTWVTTRQPVALDSWPDASRAAPRSPALTTVATWRGPFAPVVYEGTTYGLRVHEFRKFADLPVAADGPFVVALDIHVDDAEDAARLLQGGWTLINPKTVAGDPWRYQAFVQQSAGEIMIAKGVYVQTRSGWFSDRSICYLASGRPVVAQDTGPRALLPAGEGLLTFSTLQEAAAASRAVNRDYARHARAARRLAEEIFDASVVLPVLVEKLGI